MRVSLYGPEAQKAMRVPQPFYLADAHKAGFVVSCDRIGPGGGYCAYVPKWMAPSATRIH